MSAQVSASPLCLQNVLRRSADFKPSIWGDLFLSLPINDMFEQERGHVASSIECYMKEHGSATEEEAVNELRKRVSDAWKDINRSCLLPTEVPMPLLTRILNLTRVIDVVYKDEDGYTNAGIKDLVASLLLDCVPI